MKVNMDRDLAYAVNLFGSPNNKKELDECTAIITTCWRGLLWLEAYKHTFRYTSEVKDLKETLEYNNLWGEIWYRRYLRAKAGASVAGGGKEGKEGGRESAYAALWPGSTAVAATRQRRQRGVFA
jgi:hypothetical protein